MRIYATPEDLVPDWVEQAPPNAARLIRAASVMVENATRLDRYTVNRNLMPVEPNVVEAFRDAVCQQVTMWHLGQIDPDGAAVGQALFVKSQSVDGGSVTYDGFASQEERTRAAKELCTAALQILRNAGLLSASVELL